jgi:peptidoglycan/LPS O-acetylase OafA/YrhL
MVVIGHIGEFGVYIDPMFRVVYALSWIGVELFFVLSGFLITSILLETTSREGYFSRFYFRRFWRIVPVYYLVLTVTTFVFPVIFSEMITPQMADSWRGHAPWYYAFLANFMMLKMNDLPKDPVTVAWSLAIEEQFYLVWPLVVLGFRRWRPLKILGALLAFSIGLKAVLLMQGWGDYSFYLFTPTRIETLVIGSALAVAWHHGWIKSNWRFARVGCVSAVLLIAIHLLSLISDGEDGLGLVGSALGSLTYYLLIGVMFAALIGFLLTQPNSGFSQILQKRWLCQLGVWSYSIYLTHNLINHGLAQSGLTFGLLGSNVLGFGFHAALTVAVAVSVGYALYRFVERPIMSWRDRWLFAASQKSSVT